MPRESAILLIMIGGPSRDRAAERREATRREIVDAAWDVARELGLADVTLNAIADRVGMRAPSLYTHFSSKHAIYDAMYEQAWVTYEAGMDDAENRLPSQPRAALKFVAVTFFDFATADLARHQLMNLRTIPGFEPSPAAHQPAVRVYERLRTFMTGIGVTDDGSVDLYTALIGGLIDQQWANDPGSDRWRKLLDRAVDMYANELGLPDAREEQR